MTRTDAFLFAMKKVIEGKRTYIDSFDVRNIQINITISKDGIANAVVSQRSEETVVGCLDGVRKVDRYSFST
jgi:hypothetical protein